MIQFSCRDEKITQLFSIIFWILAGFHIIFGCIAQLIFFAIDWSYSYEIVDSADVADIVDIIDIRLYATALYQWNVG